MAATITNTYFTSLEPVELKYNYYRNEELQAQYIGYSQGLNVFQVNGLKNIQDIAINRGSCFILTSAISLSSFFVLPRKLSTGELPGSLVLQPRSLSAEYINYNSESNIFILTNTLSSNATTFFINFIKDSLISEILVNNKYLQIDSVYPYVVSLGDKINDPAQKYRQEFICEIFDNYVAIKVYTNGGFRYLAPCADGILRATGVVLNSQAINDFLFKITLNGADSFQYNFNPDNSWITYYLDFPSQVYNKDISLNKIFANLNTNFLLDFPIEPATKNSNVTFNLANLKTGYTPTGSPPQIDNSYDEQIITTN